MKHHGSTVPDAAAQSPVSTVDDPDAAPHGAYLPGLSPPGWAPMRDYSKLDAPSVTLPDFSQPPAPAPPPGLLARLGQQALEQNPGRGGGGGSQAADQAARALAAVQRGDIPAAAGIDTGGMSLAQVLRLIGARTPSA